MSFSSPPCTIQRIHQKDVANTWEHLDPWKSATKQRLQKMFIRKTGHYKRTKQIVQGTCSFWYNAENKKSLQIQVTHPPELLQWARQCSGPLPWKAGAGVLQAASQSLGCFTFLAEVQIVHRALMTVKTKFIFRNSYIQAGALIYCIS